MSTYLESVRTDKTFQGNIVIQIDSNYFAIRNPDSGLTVTSPYDKSVLSLVLNPTTMDIRRVTTSVSSFSFRLLDKDGIITALVLGDASPLIGKQVRIWLGRNNITNDSANDMDFADYYELPKTYIKKVDHADNSYTFSSTEETERIDRPIYDYSSALGADILAGTTTWTMRDDISDFPTSGFLKVDDEFVSYSGVDLVNNRFTGVIRGELSSVPASHDINTEVVLVETITDNPLNIILKLLISGGGGAYDVLQSGLGIDNTLIDIAEIEALRDDKFLGRQFTLSVYSVESALKYLEDQLLMPNQLRFTNSLNSKLSLALLDRASFVEDEDTIDNNTMTKYPKWSIDGNKVTNVIEIQWDYSEALNVFQKKSVFEDAASIATYGRQTSLKYDFKGIKNSLDGQNIIDDFGTRLLARLSTPTPEVQVETQIDKSLQTIGDKAYLVSNAIPAADGTLNFASYLEIISRAINQNTGVVTFKLAFTSFTNIRSGFIAPSDTIASVVSQKIVTVASGRGSYYLAGYKMRLWDNVSKTFFADAPNEIASVDGDQITFLNNWSTTLTTNYRLRFANFDDASDKQKRYAFVGMTGGADFSDGSPTYRITF